MKVKIEFDPWDEHRQSKRLADILEVAGLWVERVEVVKLQLPRAIEHAELAEKIRQALT